MWIQAVLSALTALVFAALALLLGRRSTSPEVRPALHMFRTWWFALAFVTAVRPLQVLLLRLDALPVWLYQTFQEAVVLALCIGLWGLLGYLIFAYKGRRTSWIPLAAVYAALAVFLLALVNYIGQPASLTLIHGEVEGIVGQQLPTAPVVIVTVMLVGPQLVAAAGYLGLYRRVDTPTQRYRILLISFGIIGWLGTTLVGTALQARGVGWSYVSTLLGLLAALLVWAAYFPPPAVRRRFDVAPLGRETPMPPVAPPAPPPAPPSA